MKRSVSLVIQLLTVAMLSICTLSASNVRHMNLDHLTQNAGRIFAGQVIDISHGHVFAGGVELPTVTYVFQVESSYKGDVTKVNGGQTIEMTMLAPIHKEDVAGLKFRSALPELPTMTLGKRYLIFATSPSAIGLSTTVGLGQGLFRIYGDAQSQTAVNLLGNKGLFKGMNVQMKTDSQGGLSLNELTSRVDAAIKQGGN